MTGYEPLRPEQWPVLETLFGSKGACGGCWCQWWRVERGGRQWDQTRGELARARMKALVESGRALGILAFDGEAVGWCSFGPRADFPRIETVKAYRRNDTADAWCVNCFFIARGHRGRGVARGLLAAALDEMRRRTVEIVEAYPVTTTRDGGRLAAAFSWTGPLRIFEEAGFEEIQRLAPTKPLVRLRLGERARPPFSRSRQYSPFTPERAREAERKADHGTAEPAQRQAPVASRPPGS